MANEGALQYPIIAVNDADTKHLFDNRYETGQSTLDGFIQATNFLIAGKVFTVCGYGWCGRGIAIRADGLGAKVIVTATGDKNVIDDAHFDAIKDGCVIANSGHFDVEINIAKLRERTGRTELPRDSVEEFHLSDGRKIRLLAEGRLVNLAAAEGHPAAVMDMSFANQALCLANLRQRNGELDTTVHGVPKDIDQEVARLKLQSLDVEIDELTQEQVLYLWSWREGT